MLGIQFKALQGIHVTQNLTVSNWKRLKCLPGHSDKTSLTLLGMHRAGEIVLHLGSSWNLAAGERNPSRGGGVGKPRQIYKGWVWIQVLQREPRWHGACHTWNGETLNSLLPFNWSPCTRKLEHVQISVKWCCESVWWEWKLSTYIWVCLEKWCTAHNLWHIVQINDVASRMHPECIIFAKELTFVLCII